jgi:hypothetical protein
MSQRRKNTVAESFDLFRTVKESLDICTVIQAYTGQELRRAGRNLTGLCPFHQETTPSFTVQPERGVFHCFGCGAHGSVIDFVMQLFRLSPLDAARKLAGDFGIPVPDFRTLRTLPPKERKRIEEQQTQLRKQRIRKKALRTWSEKAANEVCRLRRLAWQSLGTGQDYFEHPELILLMQYADYILELLSGNDAERAAVLEAKLREQLGMIGGFMP